MKDAEIYTIFDTEKLLNRPATVEISKTSGAAGIAYWIKPALPAQGDDQPGKERSLWSPLIQAWVGAEYGKPAGHP